MRLLFGSSAMPPLARRAFIRAALWVLLLRGGIVFGLGLWLEPVFEKTLSGPGSYLDIILLGVAALIICFYCIPYFRVMQRRLLAVGFPYPGYLVAAAVICVVSLNLLLPFAGDWRWYSQGISSAVYIAIYLALLPWPDRLPQRGRERGAGEPGGSGVIDGME